MSASDPRAFRGFGAAFLQGADRYERLRPGYPDAAVDWLADGVPAGVAVDIGAGTGKLSSALTRRGVEVIAVGLRKGMIMVGVSRPCVGDRTAIARQCPRQTTGTLAGNTLSS